MALIPPFFLNTVIAIGIIKNGEKIWTGTGFLYGRLHEQKIDDQKVYHVFLVTNKHVFANHASVIVKFNSEAGEEAKDYPIELIDQKGNVKWFSHTDPVIDVATIKLNIEFLRDEKRTFPWFNSDEHILMTEDLKNKGVTEGDRIFVLGYPMGNVAKEHQYVIARQGCIARIRDVLEKKSKEFLIDSFVFPGNSGGPVINAPELVAIKGTKFLSSARLIGIVKNYIPYQDIAASRQTGRTRVIFEENTGLTSAIPIDYVKEAVEIHHHQMEKQTSLPFEDKNS